MNIISIGEVLWDVFPDRELIGGAPFNFSAHAARLGHTVRFISAVGNDERGDAALERISELGLSTEFIQQVDVETGHVSIFVDENGQPDFTIHRPAAYDCVHVDDAVIASLQNSAPDWIYYGTVHQTQPNPRAATQRILNAFPDVPRFYDINLRKNSYSADLILDLLPQTSVLKINDEEVLALAGMLGEDWSNLEAFCRDVHTRYSLSGICVTQGAKGCSVFLNDQFVHVVGTPVKVADAVGAGDAFGAAILHAWESGMSLEDSATFANRVGALIASRHGAVPEWNPDEITDTPK